MLQVLFAHFTDVMNIQTSVLRNERGKEQCKKCYGALLVLRPPGTNVDIWLLLLSLFEA